MTVPTRRSPRNSSTSIIDGSPSWSRIPTLRPSEWVAFIELRSLSCLAEKALPGLRVPPKIFSKNFYSNAAMQIWIVREIDRTHAAFTEHLNDLITA
jgi:hypothetical protein